MEEHPKIICYEFTGLSKEDESVNKNSARINLYKRYLPTIFDNTWDIQFKGNNTIVVMKK